MKRRQKTPMLTGGIYGSKAVSLGDLDDFMDWLVSDSGKGTPQELYAAVAWSFWSANLRANSVASVPYYIYPMEMPKDEEDKDENAVEWPYPLETLLWDAEAWLTLMGAAYWLKRRKRNQMMGLQVLNANTMKVKAWDEDGPTIFEQKVGSQTRLFKAEEIVYFRSFNPKDDIREGISGGRVGQEAGQLIHNANLWAAAFFDNGAIPAVLLTTEGSVPPSEKKEVESRWSRMFEGVQKAFRTAVLERGLKPTVIGQPIKDLAMGELEETRRHQILAAHNIPPGLGDVKTNRAERDALQWEFWTFELIPYMQTRIVPALDEQLFNPLGLRISFDYNSLEAMQREEIKKAEAMAFAINGVVLPAYDANLISIDESRRVIDSVLVAASLPPLDETFEPEERTPLQLQPANDGNIQDEGPGTPGNPADNIENQTSPKALAPEWGRHRVYLQS